MDKKAKTKNLDKKYIKNPEIWIGTWGMSGIKYGYCKEEDAINTLQVAYENGYRKFDTAQFYGNGKSEYLLQKSLKTKRNKIFISSKAGIHWEGNRVVIDGSEEKIIETAIKTLKTLKTDYIDLFSLHWPDPKIDIRKSIETLKKLNKKGYIRNWGLGNLTIDHIKKIDKRNKKIPHQVHYNPIVTKNYDVITIGHDKFLNIITSPFEHGLLLKNQMNLGKKDYRRKSIFYKNEKLQQKSELLFKNTKDPNERAKKIIDTIKKTRYCDAIIIGPRHPKHLDYLIQK